MISPKHSLSLHVEDLPNPKYPSWTPESLVAYRAFLLERNPIDFGNKLTWGQRRLFEVLDLMSTDPRMREAWRLLAKREGDYRDEGLIWPPGPCERLVRACRSAVLEFECNPQRTQSESRQHYSRIADLAEQLSELLEEEGYPLYHVMAAISDRQWEILQWELEETFGKLKASDEYQELMARFGAKSEPPVRRVLESALHQVVPRPCQMLDFISRTARDQADVPVKVSQPNSEGAFARFFARSVAGYFRHAYGTPLYDVVSIITCVVTGFEIDSEAVRKLVKTDKHRS